MSKNFIRKPAGNITLPHPRPMDVSEEQWIIYKHFNNHLRTVPISRMEIKILSSIQFTADMLNCSDAHISKELVEMGLRAPRTAFPVEFLDYIDAALLRCGWDIGAPTESMINLRDLWFGCERGLEMGSFRHVRTILEDEVLNA